MDACIKVQGLLLFLVGVGIKPKALLDKCSILQHILSPSLGASRQVLDE